MATTFMDWTPQCNGFPCAGSRSPARKTRILRALMKLLAVLFAVAANPILFVTQVPPEGDFTSVTSTFGNHRGTIDSAPRGGDLWIRYPDGSLKNLTRAAGFGNDEIGRASCRERVCIAGG